ncbi:L-fucose/L-arabinose isomerase family protein [Lactococcus lactis]|uniref:L-fucose-L-arabinose isomerase n=1 Tax=Lactococcus lactis subsp. lactis A12 TaxID=1137134 RepID=S6ER19_LACLL|nr:L-fucose/L-arabinose isomerase family protein [Lactococcus lactis]CDG03775.1 Putative L-fucose-L-arabinose isomerase [Lactococcus lactis subsp. lactis A12]SBW29572.1 Putative L-fucose-L-arabinose isomerase [Lactococcus lactis subsp. lactis]
MDKIKIGFAPTRRNLFSADAAIEYANLTRTKLTKLNIDFVDITEINADGLIYDDAGVEAAAAKFKAADIDGLFIANENFGTEYAVARLAKNLDVPVLLWGPKDERPAADGSRLRDTQCGLFAIGKVLRRFKVKFTYLQNCDIDSPQFERGMQDFVRVCNVVKTFRNTRILQVGPRPFDFWTTMVNEGELLEKFNIQLSPVPIGEITSEIKRVKAEETDKVQTTVEWFKTNTEVQISDKDLEMVAALKVALKNKVEFYGCNAGAIQCWTELQDEIGILPYASLSLLQDEGIPFTCETDIHGAISELLVEAANLGQDRAIFADVNCRHPDNPNGELLQHLGVFAYSTADNKPILPQRHFVFDYPGSVAFEALKGEYTLCRFDGDNGDYSLLMGTGKGIEGPYNQGTYLYLEFANLNRLEFKLVEGPYIHHVAAIRKNVVPILYESTKYLGIKPDFFDPIEEDVKAYLRGE